MINLSSSLRQICNDRENKAFSDALKNMMDYIFDLPINRMITVDNPLFAQIHQIVAENQALVAKLNNGSPSQHRIHHILSQITDTEIDPSVHINLPFYTDFGRHLRIGKNVFINVGVMFADVGGIIIEDNVLIGPRVNIISVNHPNSIKARRAIILQPVTIKQNVWIGANATILPGVTVSENAIIAAGAVVNRDVPASTIVAGVPAKVIKEIV